jgi:hypothetical protein
MLRRESLRAGEIAAGHGGHPAIARSLQCRHHEVVRNLCGA